MTKADVTDPAESTAKAPGDRDDRRRGIDNLRLHTAKGVLINGAYQIAVVGASAVRALVVAAFLTRADYGVWGLIGLTLWTAMGLKWVFGAGEKYVQQSDEDQERAFQEAFTVECIYTVAAAPVAAVIVVAFGLLTGHTVVIAPGLTMLLLLPATALQFPFATLYRRMDYRRQRTLGAIEPIVATVLTIVLAVAGAGYWSFVVGALAGSWSSAIAALIACPYRLALRYRRGTLRSYVGFSAPLLIAGLSGLAMFQVIVLVGVGPLGLAGLGTFTLVGNLVQFTDQADAIVTETLYPAICAVRDRVELLSEIFVKSNRLSLIWAVPFGVGMTIFGSDLVHFVIGRQWLPGVPLLQILGLTTAVHHVGYNWTSFFKAQARTWPIAIAAVVTFIAVIAAAIPLMYSDHLVGLGYAFAVGEVVSLATRGILLARLFEGFRILRHLQRAFAPTVLAAGPVLAFRALNGPEHSLAAAIAVFASYVALTVLFTLALERPLLREAVGYLAPRRTQLA